MAFSVAIAQPTGVGSAVGIKGLSGAWLVEPVVVTLPPDQYAYETTIIDTSDGCTVDLTGGATAAPTLEATAGKGSVRLLCRYRATSVSRWEQGYRVVRFQRDADGSNLETVAPALNESPAETAEARGYATIMDQVVAGSSAAAPLYARTVITSGAATGLGPHNGVTLTAGDPVLVAIGSAVGNGLFVAAAGAWARSPAMPVGTLARGTLVQVGEGTEGAGELWALTAPTTGTVTVGTTAVTWEAVSGGVEERPFAPQPVVTSAFIDPSALDECVVTYSMAVVHSSLVGLSLPGTSPAVTVTGIVSGDTTATCTYQLSGNVDPLDAPNFACAAVTGIRSQWGATCQAGSVAVVFGLPAAPSVAIVNGQSNAAAVPPTTIGYSYVTQYQHANVRAWDPVTQAFVQAVDGHANFKTGTAGVGTGAGPGLGQVFHPLARSFADALAAPVRFFAHAYTSQGIAYFLPASGTRAYYSDGTQHGSLNNFNLVAQEVLASGVTPEVYYFVQGEADAADSQATYYAKLTTLVDAIRAQWPAIHVVLVTTISAVLANTAGVRAAQDQMATERSYVHIVDTTDMATSGMHWSGGINTGEHYEIPGYRELSLRIAALHAGTTRPAVTPAVHYDQIGASPPIHRYQDNRSITHPSSRDECAVLQDSIGAQSLGGPGGGAQNPTHIPYDSDFNGRSTLDFNRANTETLSATINEDGADAGETWTVAFTAKSRAFGSPGFTASFMHMFDFGNSERLGVQVPLATKWCLFYGGGGSTDTGPIADAAKHDHVVVIDGAANQVRWYQDGVLAATKATAGDQNLVNAIRLDIGSVLNTGHWDGRAANMTLWNVALDATAAGEFHAASVVEYGA